MLYSCLKFLHILGVVLLIGNVTITAFWKVLADRTGDPSVIAHAQRGVVVADWLFTVPGILLIIGGGYGMTWVGGLDLSSGTWLVAGQILFVVSGVIWIAILIPTQIKQARLARTFVASAPIPQAYRRLNSRWLIWGILGTIPLICAIFLMIVKP